MASKRMQLDFTAKEKKPTGEFTVKNANRINRLYFPLFNMQGMMSAVTPELKGDIKTGQNSFLTEPQVSESILQTKNSRNFWVKINNKEIWSVPGISADEAFQRAKNMKVCNTDVFAGPGYFSTERIHKKSGLKARTDVFVPSNGDSFEISLITLSNTSSETLTLLSTAAVPLYGRSADNLRDHRQVTTMLNRTRKHSNGIILCPTMSFDERGHKPCANDYSAFAFSSPGETLEGVVSDLEAFIGEGGNLEAPEMIYADKAFEDSKDTDGKQCIAALRFKSLTLNPGESRSFAILLGIHNREENWIPVLERYNSIQKVMSVFEETKVWWKNQVERLVFMTGDQTFNNWLVWVSLQPVMRRIFGCSFLPDFGYGRGGRGWRDLWQDCLGILLTNPSDTRDILLNNIQGVRIDGSNATIIGLKPGEFIADRNNIPRTWMDHGVWPTVTIDLYVQQTGDYSILLEKRPFFQDRFSHRSKKINPDWKKEDGTWLKNKKNEVVKNEIFIHLLLQNLTQFFNRGEHGNIRLEDADWNDGLDMAHGKGESVPFSAAFAANLATLARYCSILASKGITTLSLPSEMLSLIKPGIPAAFLNDPVKLQAVLQAYFIKVEKGEISGEQVFFNINELSEILNTYSEALKKQIRDNEFISTGKHEYFNGYYNNNGVRLEGMINNEEQMTLTGQVFPIMSGVATESQCKKAFKAAGDLLRDKEHQGFRLNTNFGKMMLNMGRAFSFNYGDKENGSFFSHMNVMFANGLYRRGLVKEGFEVINSIYKMWKNTGKSLFFPCVPEYFNGEGRARYCYITGSAAWTVMTMLLEVFGIRGIMGNLSFNPKLLSKQFDKNCEISVQTLFQGKKIIVTYKNPEKLSYGQYKIGKLRCQNKDLAFKLEQNIPFIEKEVLNQFAEPLNLEIELIKK